MDIIVNMSCLPTESIQFFLNICVWKLKKAIRTLELIVFTTRDGY